MAQYSLFIISFVIAVLPYGGFTDSFGVNISNTRCNLDPRLGQVQDPCPSMYNGECVGGYCRCKTGYEEHPNLHRCVPHLTGTGSRQPSTQQSGSALDDLPFDYIPPSQSPAASSGGVSSTPCSSSKDPCPTMYRHSFCGPSGTCQCMQNFVEHATLRQCVKDERFGHHDDDFRAGANDRDHMHGGCDHHRGGVTTLATMLLTLAFRNHF